MITVGFDLDGVISLLPLRLKQVMLTRSNEKFFWWLQKFRFLQRFYNFLLRKPNAEIRKTMEELEERGFRVIIISAESENYRQELKRWLLKNKFCFTGLYLKTTLEEDCLSYKKRMASLCVYYLDDKSEVVNHINGEIDGDGRCLALLYQGQKKDELFKLLPLFRVLKTV